MSFTLEFTFNLLVTTMEKVVALERKEDELVVIKDAVSIPCFPVW